MNRDPKWVRLLNQHDLAGGELAWPEVMAFDAALWLLQKGVHMRSARAWPFPAGSCGQFYLSCAWLLAIASQKPRRAAGLVGGDLYLFLFFIRPHLFHFPMPRGRPVLIKLIELLSFYSSALHLPRFKHFKMFLNTRKFKNSEHSELFSTF